MGMHFGGRPQGDTTANTDIGIGNFNSGTFVYQGIVGNESGVGALQNQNDIGISPDGKHIISANFRSQSTRKVTHYDTPWNFTQSVSTTGTSGTAAAVAGWCDGGMKTFGCGFTGSFNINQLTTRWDFPNTSETQFSSTPRSSIPGNSAQAMLCANFSQDGLNFLYGVNTGAAQNLYHVTLLQPYDFTGCSLVSNITSGLQNTFYQGCAWSYDGKYIFAGYAIALNNSNCCNVFECPTPYDTSNATRVGNFAMSSITSNNLNGLDYAYDPVSRYHYLIACSSSSSDVYVRRWN